MKDKVFIDTNLWVYLYSDEEKGKTIKNLVDKHFENANISTQVLGEFFHVMTRKGIKGKKEAKQIILNLMTNFKVIEVSQSTVIKALTLSVKYDYSYWDSLIMASALENNCSILYTEDMQNEQIIENTLKIINPFEYLKKP